MHGLHSFARLEIHVCAEAGGRYEAHVDAVHVSTSCAALEAASGC